MQDLTIALGAIETPRHSTIISSLRPAARSWPEPPPGLRSVADGLLRLLIARLKSRTLFDPARGAHEAPPAPAPEPA
ncbi:MAG TPA: hypothetical protein VFK02_36390 [Kofleriaceae bacterium]|nr:hypothetical protein [Kofleriaceae bacterium]